MLIRQVVILRGLLKYNYYAKEIKKSERPYKKKMGIKLREMRGVV